MRGTTDPPLGAATQARASSEPPLRAANQPRTSAEPPLRAATQARTSAQPPQPSAPPPRRPASSRPSAHRAPGPRRQHRPHVLNPDHLPDHLDHLYRAAWALCGSRHDAEDLVQETFVNILKRPRLLRDGNELGYLLRALRNTYTSRYRRTVNRPSELQLLDSDAPTVDALELPDAREIMAAIASAPAVYRDAVIAVDVLGLSYREAAHSLRTRESTITTRLHRGRQHIARELRDELTTTPRRR